MMAFSTILRFPLKARGGQLLVLRKSFCTPGAQAYVVEASMVVYTKRMRLPCCYGYTIFLSISSMNTSKRSRTAVRSILRLDGK
mmetsp:Transcript_125583/g.222546  ORF Transcript_125583/g.222546 Transcript_125583/m.222546 type:complete len:84 (+) Transcript_125583:363-614(+)